MAVVISPLEGLRDVLARWPRAHVCGLLGPEMAHPALPVPEARRLRLTFNDITRQRDALQPPGMEHVRAIVAFAHAWAAEEGSEAAKKEEDERAPLVFHCWAGISRSPAAAFIAACALRPQGAEADLARSLRTAAPKVTPNRRMVELADTLLGRGGRMAAAIAAMGRGREAAWGDVVIWSLGPVPQGEGGEKGSVQPPM